MLRYLYVPKNLDLYDHIDYAVKNNFNQIIHGESDVVKDFIIDPEVAQEINIPEYRSIFNKNLVFKEGEDFLLTLIDEFDINDEYDSVEINIFRINDKDMSEKVFIIQKNMEKVQPHIYQANISLESYGEYIFNVVTKSEKNNKEDIIIRENIVIYKEYREDEIDDKFFFS
jgi:hypothetical protein